MATIFYFSGSGNSLAIAKGLSERLEGNVKSIANYVKSPTIVEDELIGIVTPVHCTELPPIVQQFLQIVKISGAPYIFAVANMGALAGDTLGQAKTILAARGLTLNAGFTIPMPDNSIAFPSPEGLKAEMLQRLEQRVETIAFDVQGKRDNSSTLTRSPLWQVANPIGWLVMDKVLKVKERFVDTSICVHCGTCVKVCPMDVIELVDGLPSFAQGCVSCFACAQWCPVNAIRLGKLTLKDKVKYTNPALSPEELLEYNKK